MNLNDVIIDLSPKQKEMLVNKRRKELTRLGYSVILTTALAELIAQARHQGSLEHAR